MKYLVLLVVAIVAIGIWRSRRPTVPATPPQARPPGSPQDMVACAHCGLHLPQADALFLGSRPYCSAEHRHQGPAPGP